MWHAGDSLAAAPDEWVRLGLALTPAEQAEPVLTAAQLGLAATINDDLQTVDFLVPASRLPAQAINGQRVRPPLSPRVAGLLINTDLAASWSERNQGLSLGHELRTGGRWGIFSTTGQANWTSNGGATYQRGQTQWQFDDYTHLRTWQAGDVVGGAVSPVNLGGFRLAKNPAGLDPYTPTYPLPTLGGLALDASTLTVLANQSEVARHDVQKGPWTLERFPLNVGRNALDVVVRDPFGRETTVPQGGYYFVPQMLAQGLSTWDVSVGAVRQGLSDHYGPVGGTANWAYGLSDRWTLHAGGEASASGTNLSLGAQTTLGNAGTVSAQGTWSRGDGHNGWAGTLAYSFQGPRWGLRFEHTENHDLWDLAAVDAFVFRPEQQTRLSATYTSDAQTLQFRAALTDMTVHGRRTRYASLGGQWHAGHQTLSASVLYDAVAHAPTVQLGYLRTFGQASASLQTQRSDRGPRTALAGSWNGHLGEDSSMGASGELARTETGNAARANANLRTPLGEARLQVFSQGDSKQVSGNWSSSLFLGAGGVHTGPRLQEGFALVEVPGVADVPVMQGGRVLGHTDASGTLLVGPLPALTSTPLRLDDKALPPGVQLDTSTLPATPMRRSGAKVVFPVRTLNARTFTVNHGGVLVPLGSTVESPTETTQVGYDGALFLEHATAGQSLTVRLATGGVCAIKVPTPLPAFADQPTLSCE